MIKNVEFKTPNTEVLQETNLASFYDNISEKIVREREDFEGKDSGWTLDEILRFEVCTNRYFPFRVLNLHNPTSLLDLVGKNLPFRPQRTKEEFLVESAISSQSSPRSKTGFIRGS
ncbi:hypothetical protein TNCV_4196341 [Trichonephila clavipes]|nr:hypothetical protein TNCV_4196341 [Trichonephila clavipes]